jgi:hypothetical protein
MFWYWQNMWGSSELTELSSVRKIQIEFLVFYECRETSFMAQSKVSKLKKDADKSWNQAIGNKTTNNLYILERKLI